MLTYVFQSDLLSNRYGYNVLETKLKRTEREAIARLYLPRKLLHIFSIPKII